MKTAVEILEKARSLIDKPEKWIKGQNESVDNHGNACYCLNGACVHASIGALIGQHHEHTEDTCPICLSRTLIQAALPDYFRQPKAQSIDSPIIRFNDDPVTTHQQVLEVLDKAIEEAKKREKK